MWGLDPKIASIEDIIRCAPHCFVGLRESPNARVAGQGKIHPHIRREQRFERRQSHHDATAGIPVNARRLNVERRALQRRANLGRGQIWIERLEQCRDRTCVRDCRGDCPKRAGKACRLFAFHRELRLTPSAAVMSGFCRTVPPVDEKSPGVMAVPSGLKKMRRSPSELNVSTGLAAPPVNRVALPGRRRCDAERVGRAHALWPRVLPGVEIASLPRPVSRWRKRPAPANFTITMRSPIFKVDSCS